MPSFDFYAAKHNALVHNLGVDFLNRHEELERLDRALRPGSLVAIWGRRRVGKSRLLIEWCRCRDGLYTVADQSSPTVQRRYMAAAIAQRFAGFADVEYPDWRSLLARLSAEAARVGWPGPVIIDELPYLVAADPTIAAALQNWVDSTAPRPCAVVSGSSQQMMHGAVLDASAPLYGRAVEAFAVRPLLPRHLGEAFGLDQAAPRHLVSLYALWGGMPRYWELAAPWTGRPGADGRWLEDAVDALVLDPSGPLHDEAERLLALEVPPAAALRPLLDAIGAGAHRLSEIAGRLGRAASSLSRPLATLTAMQLVRRETPFGSPPRTGKRALYRIDDPFLRLWFRTVAPHRAMLGAAPKETRLTYWRNAWPTLAATAWEELCRRAVPLLHRSDTALGRLGPWEPAQRYWRGNAAELDIVARSVDGERLLIGEAKWSSRPLRQLRANLPSDAAALRLPGAGERELVRALFVPAAPAKRDAGGHMHLVDAAAVMEVLR